MPIIKTKKELKFYIMADRILAGLPATPTIGERIKTIVWRILGYRDIQLFLTIMRKLNYYRHQKGIIFRFLEYYYNVRYTLVSQKLGFSIGCETFGWGLRIPHYGTIVINGETIAGNLCVLHTCTCVGGGNKRFGNAFYLATGSQVMRPCTLGNNVTVAAHSLVNTSYGDNVLLVGSPAVVKKYNSVPWYELDNYKYRVYKIFDLKEKMNIPD